MDQNTAQQITTEIREALLDELCDVMLAFIDQGLITEDQAQNISNFILGQIDTINDYDHLIPFLEQLATTWPMYNAIYLRIKSEHENKNKLADLHNQVSQLVS